MIFPEIVLQPKQAEVYELIEQGSSTWVGNGGGRGGAKSGGMQRVMLARCLERPGTVRCIVMRNSDQVRRYHEDVMLRHYPELEPYYKKTERKIVLPMAKGPASELIFTHAESLDDVINRFRSANFFDVAVDQAEQFSEQELREIKQAVRWPGVPMGTCKLYLAFNMGGVGIDFLRRVFHLRTYRENERADEFKFVHVRPFDNVEWVRVALTEDGLTEEDYYSWSDAQRAEYCATRSDYGRALVSQDEALVQRDFWGSWESLEGAFFGRVYDRDKTVLSPEVVSRILKPWWQKWLSQDWGRGHYCATYWHARGEMSPEEVKKLLGWEVSRPLKVVLTYREYIAGGAAAQDEGGTREISEEDIARAIVERTPLEERKRLSEDGGAFYLSPDAFAKRSSKNTIAQSEGAILTKSGLPYPQPADTDVVGGWSLMSNLLLETKREGSTGESVWLISANCPELISAIPLLMRDPKDLDRVLKTDKGAAKIEMDSSEACFVAGTMIAAERGELAIEQVAPGDRVWTRGGLRTVRHSWMSNPSATVMTLHFSNGKTITGTPNHPVYLCGFGFYRLDALRYGDTILTWEESQKSLSSTASSSIATRTPKTRRTADISSRIIRISAEAWNRCIGKCTNLITGRFPMATMSTIKAQIHSTIRLLIWRLSPNSNTHESIGHPPNESPNCVSNSIQSGTKQRSGTAETKGEPWRERMPSTYGTASVSQSSAASAAAHSRGSRSNHGSAPMPASQNGGEPTTSTTLNSLARAAGSGLPATDTTSSDSAPVYVLGLTTETRAQCVFNLEVEDAHEYFANGILVHNCRYGLKSMLQPGRKPEEEVMEEKLAKMREAGLDDNSLYIHRRRLEMELQQAEQPIAVGRRHSLVRRIGR